MAPIVSMDRAGRIVVPAEARKRLHLKPGSRFVVAEVGDGKLLLLPLDVEAIAARLVEELKGFDIEATVRRVRGEIEDLAAKRYPPSGRGGGRAARRVH